MPSGSDGLLIAPGFGGVEEAAAAPAPAPPLILLLELVATLGGAEDEAEGRFESLLRAAIMTSTND